MVKPGRKIDFDFNKLLQQHFPLIETKKHTSYSLHFEVKCIAANFKKHSFVRVSELLLLDVPCMLTFSVAVCA